MVPKDQAANVDYRIRLREECNRDSDFRRAVMDACRHDVLYFFSAFCIAKSTLVVTDVGLVPIEKVTSRHKVWDGDSWVSQGGAIFQGHKDVISAYGIKLTPDHKVWTKNGWQIASKRYDRIAIRLPDGCSERWKLRENNTGSVALPMPVRENYNDKWVQLAERTDEELRLLCARKGCGDEHYPWNDGHKHIPHLAGDVAEVFEQELRVLQELRREGNQSLRSLEGIQQFLGGHGCSSRRSVYREDRQQQGVFSRQLQVGHLEGASKQYKAIGGGSENKTIGGIDWDHHHRCLRKGEGWLERHWRARQVEEKAQNPEGHVECFGDSKVGWHNYGQCESQNKSGANGRSALASVDERQAPVYDLINCGPRRAFTVIGEDGSPLLVHNCWLYEPRPRFIDGIEQPKIFPFVPWSHQIPIIRDIKASLGSSDIGVEKSRGEGASWIGCLLALHDWLFDDMAAIGLVSRNLDAADSPDDPDSLMWKLDHSISLLPPFMVGLPDLSATQRDWKRDRSRHNLKKHSNGATITAYAAVGDVASGGRKKWFLCDELAKWQRGPDYEAMASTEPVTESRLIVSTPKGAEGAYYDIMHAASSMKKLKLHWMDNPSRNRGLYRLKDMTPIAIDPVNNPLPAHYDPVTKDVLDLYSRLRKNGFVLENTIRSEWYDQRCDRAGSTPQNIAQEYDLDYGGSAYRVFNSEFINMAKETAKVPLTIGVMAVNTEEVTCHFEEVEKGPWSLWCTLDHKGKPKEGEYVVACDVGTGSGGSHTSNSTITVVDRRLKEQVAEFASNIIDPISLADLAIAVSRMFYGAYLIWEHNGPGGGFTKRVAEQNYSPAYERTILFKRKGVSKGDKTLGWWTSKSTKEVMFSDLNSSVRQREIIIRSRPMVEEAGQYVRDGDRIVFSGTMNKKDPNVVGENHGDRVIAFSLALQAMKDRPIQVVKNKGQDPDNPPYGTMAWREKQRREEEEQGKGDWDERGPQDFVRNEIGQGIW